MTKYMTRRLNTISLFGVCVCFLLHAPQVLEAGFSYKWPRFFHRGVGLDAMAKP